MNPLVGTVLEHSGPPFATPLTPLHRRYVRRLPPLRTSAGQNFAQRRLHPAPHARSAAGIG